MNDSLMQGAWPEAASLLPEPNAEASLFLLRQADQQMHARGSRRRRRRCPER